MSWHENKKFNDSKNSHSTILLSRILNNSSVAYIFKIVKGMSAVLTNDKSYKMSERLVKDMRHETVYVLNIDHKTPFSICPSFIFVGDRMLRNIIQY